VIADDDSVALVETLMDARVGILTWQRSELVLTIRKEISQLVWPITVLIDHLDHGLLFVLRSGGREFGPQELSGLAVVPEEVADDPEIAVEVNQHGTRKGLLNLALVHLVVAVLEIRIASQLEKAEQALARGYDMSWHITTALTGTFAKHDGETLLALVAAMVDESTGHERVPEVEAYRWQCIQEVLRNVIIR
jgi:hypothetical protein